MSKVTTLQDLAAAVPSDSRVAIGGFQLSRVPVALLRAITDRGTKGLQALTAPNPFALEILAVAGCLRSADCGFIGFQYEGGFVIPPRLQGVLAKGEVTLRQRDVYETIGDLRAAAVATEPLADFALVHAQRADADGNLEIDDPYVDVLLAGAAGQVLATAEALVERVHRPTIPGARVVAVAIAPAGAAPTACYGHYPYDPRALSAQLGLPETVAPDRGAAGADRIDGAGAANHNAGPGLSGPPGSDAESVDTYIIELARQVRDAEVVVTGLASAVPMLAIEVARRTHAPRARYISCVGAVNPRLESALPTSVDPDLLRHCEETIDLPDLFDLARNGGVDAMFFGAGQVDAGGHMNLSRVGPATSPTLRLPGPAGSPSMRSFVRRVLIGMPRQSRRNLVQAVDAATSSPGGRNEETIMVTDIATWQLAEGGFTPLSLRRGATLHELSSRTGFAFAADRPTATPPPTDFERATLRQIDRAGLRFRMLGRPTPSPTEKNPTDPSKSSKRVLHER